MKKKLHHYTTTAGLEGIAVSNHLWATDFVQLNDGDEIIYAMGAVYREGAKLAMARMPKDLRNGVTDQEVLDKMPAYMQQT